MKSNDIIQEAYGLGRLGGASVSSGQSTNTNNSSNVNTKGPSNTSKVVKGSKVSALSQNFWMKDFMGELNSMLNSAKVGGLLQDKDNTIDYIFSIFASYMQPIKLDKIKDKLPSIYDQIESVINSIADTFIKNKQFDQQLLSQLGEIGWATSKMNNPEKYVGPKNDGIDPTISTNLSSERIGPMRATNSSPKNKIISKQLELFNETQQLSKRVTESEKRVEKLKKLLEK